MNSATKIFGVTVIGLLVLAVSDVSTFKEVLLNKSQTVTLKTLYIDAKVAPAEIAVNDFSFTGEHGQRFGANVLFVPVGTLLSDAGQCKGFRFRLHDRWSKLRGERSINMYAAPEQVQSSTWRILWSGPYMVVAISCQSEGILNFRVSSSKIGAHEEQWWMLFTAFASLYFVICGAIYLTLCYPETRPYYAREFASLVSISFLMALSAVVTHIEPEKETTLYLKTGVIVLKCAALTTLMVTLLIVSAAGCFKNGGPHPFLFVFLFGSFLWILVEDVWKYDLACQVGFCPVSSSTSRFGPLVASSSVYCYMVIRRLARSIRACSALGLVHEQTCFQKISVVGIIWFVLGGGFFCARNYDFPRGGPETWPFHLFVEVYLQCAQAFGVVVTLSVCWGLNPAVFDRKTVAKGSEDLSILNVEELSVSSSGGQSGVGQTDSILAPNTYGIQKPE